jgi:hypothetical protein
MKIHLIRSSELDKEKFLAIHSLIHQYAGPVSYLIHERPSEITDDELIREIWDEDRLSHKVMFRMEGICQSITVPYSSWDNLFNRCDQARQKHRIPDDEPIVLLTEHANEHNWFSAADPGGKLNFFIHTGMWDRFISDDFRYPVVYELASVPIQLKMFDSFKELLENAHRVPRGCINDLCEDKIQIQLKLRTGDICPDCRKRINSRTIDPQLIDQVFRIFEGIRIQMLFRASFHENSKPSRLVLDYDQRKIFLTDLGNLEIRLNPMEMTVYHFFLKHPDGIAFTALPDYRDELLALYKHYCKTDLIAKIHNRVEDLCSNRNDCLSQVISRIRRRFEEALPEEMAEQYVIGGEAGRKRRIKIDGSLVLIN